jgi:hypothetical protein
MNNISNQRRMEQDFSAEITSSFLVFKAKLDSLDHQYKESKQSIETKKAELMSL